MRIFLDLDGTLVNCLTPWMDELNFLTGKDYRPKDVNQWDLRSQLYPELSNNEFYAPTSKPGFWSGLQPYPGAVDFVASLEEAGHELYISTATVLYEGCGREKERWVQEHLGWDRDRVVFSRRKHLLCGDVIIDDNPDYIDGFQGVKILFNQPWNASFDIEKDGRGIWYRVYGYMEATVLTELLSRSFFT